jgi:hypothetical protein
VRALDEHDAIVRFAALARHPWANSTDDGSSRRNAISPISGNPDEINTSAFGYPGQFNRAILRLMTASHPRRKAVTAALAAVFLVVVSACGSSSPQSSSSVSVQCNAGAICSSGTVTSGSNSLTVTSDPSGSNQTVSAELVTGQPLHCDSLGKTDTGTAIFSSTATDASKTVTLAITGAPGQAIVAAHRSHPHYIGCFGAPQPFNGYTNGRNGRAVLVQADNLYEAAILPCSTTDTKPCFSYSTSGDTVILTIQTAAGDPKITPGP